MDHDAFSNGPYECPDLPLMELPAPYFMLELVQSMPSEPYPAKPVVARPSAPEGMHWAKSEITGRMHLCVTIPGVPR